MGRLKGLILTVGSGKASWKGWLYTLRHRTAEEDFRELRMGECESWAREGTQKHSTSRKERPEHIRKVSGRQGIRE